MFNNKFTVAIVSLVFLLGVAISTGFDVNGEYVFLITLVFILSLLVVVVSGRRSYVGGIILFSLCLVGGFFVSNILVGDISVEILDEGAIQADGVVTGEVINGEKKARYKVSLEGQYQSINVLVFEDLPSFCKYSDFISVKGFLSVPKDFVSKQGRDVPYKTQLKKDGVDYIVRASSVECARNEDQTILIGLHSGLFDLKETFLKKTARFIQEPEHSVLAGILLGERSDTGKDLLDAFRIAGLLHIIVLSGYNITLVAEATRRSLFFLPRNLRFILSIILVILFVLLAGAQPPAIRAGIMGSLVILAGIFRRKTVAINLLALTAVLMVLLNPLVLLYDFSFQLSVLATTGLIVLSPFFEKRLKFIPEKFQLRGIVSATISTQIFLLPYLIYRIGEISLIGVVANILVLPLIPLGMLFGFFTGVAGFIYGPLASALSVPSYLILSAISNIAQALSNIPFASIVILNLPNYMYALFFLIVFLITGIIFKKELLD